MKLPIDTTGMRFLAAGPPEPVLDFESKAPRVDDSGAPLHSVQVVALNDGGAEVNWRSETTALRRSDATFKRCQTHWGKIRGGVQNLT